MAKPGARSTSTPNAAGNAGGGGQAQSTHPTTRTIDPGRAGESGSVQATPEPVLSIASMESRAQKPQRPQVPISSQDIPVTPAEAEKVPSPAPPLPR